MTNHPLVSVIVPTCDRPDLLDRSMSSILAQTFEDYEVIVVDDGTHRAVPDAMFDDPRVRVIPCEGASGPGPARNRGIEAARGEYVAFLDDDDLWLPDKLTVSVQALQEHPEAGVVFHRTGRPGEDVAADNGQLVHSQPAQMFATRQTPHVDSVMIRRELLDEVRFSEDLPAAAEVDLFLRLAKISPFVELDATYALFHPSPDAPSRVSVEARIAARHQLTTDGRAPRHLLEPRSAGVRHDAPRAPLSPNGAARSGDTLLPQRDPARSLPRNRLAGAFRVAATEMTGGGMGIRNGGSATRPGKVHSASRKTRLVPVPEHR